MACTGTCSGNGQYFTFPNQQLNFQDAARFCESRGSQLVSTFNQLSISVLNRCCNLRSLQQNFWVGLQRNSGRCRNGQFPYQRVGSERNCVNGNPLFINRLSSNSDCVGVALVRTRQNDRTPRAAEFLCQNRLRFVCYSQTPPSTSSTASTATTSQWTTTTKRTTQTTPLSKTLYPGRELPNKTYFFNVTGYNDVLGTPSNTSSAERLLVKGAIGGAAGLLLLLIIVAFTLILCKKDKKNSVEEMAKRRRNETTTSNSYYSFEPCDEKKKEKKRVAVPSISTISSPHIDDENAHYIVPDTSPLPSRRETTVQEDHEYMEIDHYHEDNENYQGSKHTYESMISVSSDMRTKNLIRLSHETPRSHSCSIYTIPEGNE